MMPGAGTDKALSYLADRLGISKSEIMALGDGSNDEGLLKAAGLSVAMRNAADSLKAMADFIAPSAEEDGAAQMIEKYVLSE